MTVAGIDKWAAGIRYRMANDPGRQDLDDHILCNGFLFLDEYLEDILTGTRTECVLVYLSSIPSSSIVTFCRPIIELTKTPGRRKDTSKKVKTTTATFEAVPFQVCPFHSLR